VIEQDRTAMAVRARAARVCHEVRHHGRSLSTALPAAEEGLEANSRALLRELSYGALRYAPRFDVWLERLLTRPLRRRDAEVGALLAVGLYDMFHLRTPDHAAVYEAVAVARKMKPPWAAGLVNAVLRAARREETQLLRLAKTNVVAAYAHPAWLVERFRCDWPEDWETLCEANNARAPMVLRVNLMRGTRENYRQRLAAEGIESHILAEAPAALRLEEAVDVSRLPGFFCGDVSVQDSAAQLAAGLLAARPGERVLDACAAPGGKTAHILESVGGDLELTAVERDPARMESLRDTLARLGLRADLKTADFAALETWWDERPFARVLLDAPCSATGVIRRHPDIKSLRRAEDIGSLAGAQQVLLETAWKVLAPGGRLVYATCSVLREENVATLETFLSHHANAREEVIAAPWGRAEQVGRQILPGEGFMDGFYYAVLIKEKS